MPGAGPSCRACDFMQIGGIGAQIDEVGVIKLRFPIYSNIFCILALVSRILALVSRIIALVVGPSLVQERGPSAPFF